MAEGCEPDAPDRLLEEDEASLAVPAKDDSVALGEETVGDTLSETNAPVDPTEGADVPCAVDLASEDAKRTVGLTTDDGAPPVEATNVDDAVGCTDSETGPPVEATNMDDAVGCTDSETEPPVEATNEEPGAVAV